VIRRRNLIIVAALSGAGLIVATVVNLRRPALPPGLSSQPPARDALVPQSKPTYSKDKLRPQIAEAIGLSGVAPRSRRSDLVRTLRPETLNTDEVDALLYSMSQPCPVDVSPAVHSTYVHEIACVLEKRPDASSRLAKALAALARDTQRDDSLRDYAIQHLREVWRRAGDDLPLRVSIVSTFHEFSGLDPYIATPSILSLHLLGNEAGKSTAGAAQFHVPDAELAPFLDRIFTEKTTAQNAPSRLTAVRIVAERRLVSFRKPLLAILKDNNEQALVRMASANALGKIADPADIQILSSIKPADARVAAAINHILQHPVNH